MDLPRPALRVVAGRARSPQRGAPDARDGDLEACDRRAVSTIGRHARLELSFGVRRGRTVLERCYAEPPFRVGRVFDLHGAAYLIIVCSGPGIFGGDLLQQTIGVARGARVVLTSQAALQVRPSPPTARLDTAGRVAVLRSNVHVDDDGELHCLWDPAIPFADARLDQRFDIRIARGSRLYWSDAIMSGRVSRGEAWRFESLAHELALRVDERLAYLERYDVHPCERRMDRQWLAGSAQYLGTSLVHHPDASPGVAERWHSALSSSRAGVQCAVDVPEPGLIAARLVSSDGAAFSRIRARHRAAALDDIFRAPELAGRK